MRAIEALLTNSTTRAAAEAAKVSEATLWRWLNEQPFQTAYRTARRQVVEQAIGQLQQCGGVAVNALREIAARQKSVSFSACCRRARYP